MSIYLDSAIIAEARVAQELGWVKGITTNPNLLGKTDLPVELTLKGLASLTTGPIFYQLVSSDFEEMLAEGKQAFEMIGSQIVLKIPASLVGFKAVACLMENITCAVTSIYSPSQALVAVEAGAKYAITYVDRTTRLMGDGIALVTDMASILAGSQTEIMAASIKSPTQAIASLRAGARHLTLPLRIIQSLTNHELSLQTIDEFASNGKGII